MERTSPKPLSLNASYKSPSSKNSGLSSIFLNTIPFPISPPKSLTVAKSEKPDNPARVKSVAETSLVVSSPPNPSPD